MNKFIVSVLMLFAMFAIPAFAVVAANGVSIAKPAVESIEKSSFSDIVANFFQAFPAWIAALTALVTGATMITALTPSRSDDKVLDKILKVLNFLAGNFYKNTNHDSKLVNIRSKDNYD